jgi:hypothetical protein
MDFRRLSYSYSSCAQCPAAKTSRGLNLHLKNMLKNSLPSASNLVFDL